MNILQENWDSGFDENYLCDIYISMICFADVVFVVVVCFNKHFTLVSSFF